MSDPFGSHPVTVLRPAGLRTGDADMAAVREGLSPLSSRESFDAPGLAQLTLVEAAPTAAFSRRDALRPGYPAARDLLAAAGLAPILRPVGGHLAAYGPGSLVLHLWAPHPEPRLHIRERFALLGNAVATAFRGLGVDAAVGRVPGEYCDGEFSVNLAGRAKLVGTGQRIVRSGYLFSAVVMVHSAGSVREPLERAYAQLGLDFDPGTVGCLADGVPDIRVPDVRDALLVTLGAVLPLR